MHIRIKRWVYSPLDARGVPLVADLCVSWRVPCAPPPGQPALVLCELLPGGLVAVRQHPQMSVLPSRHSAQAIPTDVASGLSALGAQAGMTTHQLLEVLAAKSVEYEPEE